MVWLDCSLAEIEAVTDPLREIVESVGKSHLDVKEAVACFGEKASRFNLRRERPGGSAQCGGRRALCSRPIDDTQVGNFKALEAVSLRRIGKVALGRGASGDRGDRCELPKWSSTICCQGFKTSMLTSRSTVCKWHARLRTS